jgi:hypothetical protein
MIKKTHVNLDGLKLNQTHPLLVCTDDDDLLGENTHTTKKEKKTKPSFVTSKEVGLEANTEQINCRTTNVIHEEKKRK